MQRWLQAARAAALALAMLSATSLAHAQETAITGTVADSTDARLPGVTVTALHVQTGNTFLGLTDSSGQYIISGLRTGQYKITAELTGFRTVAQDNVEILVGQRAVVNFRLQLATMAETVTVDRKSTRLNSSH